MTLGDMKLLWEGRFLPASLLWAQVVLGALRVHPFLCSLALFYFLI